MIGDIVEVHRAFNEFECCYVYEVIIQFKKMPELKCGICEVSQK